MRMQHKFDLQFEKMGSNDKVTTRIQLVSQFSSKTTERCMGNDAVLGVSPDPLTSYLAEYRPAAQPGRYSSIYVRLT